MTTTTVLRKGCVAHRAEANRQEAARLASLASDYGNAYITDPDGSEGCLYEARRLKRIADALLTVG